MTKDVMITIKGLQKYEGMEDDSVELVTAGTLTSQPDGYHLTYQESEITGMEGTTTEFQLQPGRVTLLRTGQVCTQMVFEEGRRHLALYDTPYGSMEVGVSASKVHDTIDDHGGRLDIVYSVEIDNALASQNYFRIHVREPGAGGVKQ